MNINTTIKLLISEYGNRLWQRHHEPLSELILTILSQNTSDVNSGRAFAALTSRFDTWGKVASAKVEEIEYTIREGGLSRIKSVRIKTILDTILNERGYLELSFLNTLQLEEAKLWLQKLPGVGPKTVGCVLLFSLGKPVLPVDTHVYRVSKRLGLIENGVSVEKAHELLQKIVPSDDIYQFHMTMVDHGRKICRAQHPKCPDCVLQHICQFTLLNN